MKTGNLTKIGTTLLLTPALLIATLPAGAQQLYRRGDDHDRARYQQRYVAPRGYRYPVAPTYRSGYYVAPAYGYTYPTAPVYGDNSYYRQDNGIGPGKGAAIGAVSGAVLGALLGGGKGAVIGGAAGAGVGAVAGQAAQDNRRAQYGY